MIAAVICALHLVLRYRFPIPWPDETSFVSQAFALARHGTLFVPGLNPDRVVMWMPPGYMLFLAGIFKTFGYSFALVRWVAAACVVGCALIIGLLIRRFVHPRWAPVLHVATVAAFLTPAMLMTSNIGRMDGFLAITILMSLLAFTRGLPLLAAAIVAAAATIHFNAVYFIPPTAAYVLACIVEKRRPAIRRAELAAIGVAVVILCSYGVFIKANLAGFVTDMGFQFQLKRFMRGVDHDHPAWSVLAACALCALVLVRQRRIDTVFVVALYGAGFVLMATEGKEIWYDFADPLGFLLIAVALGAAPPAQPAGIVGVAACVLCLLVTGFSVPLYMRPILPTRAMLSRKLLPSSDMARARDAIAKLPPGSAVDIGWNGMQPFFLDALDHAGVHWIFPQHSVTDLRMDRVPDLRIICVSPDVPFLQRYIYQSLPSGRSMGCDIVLK